ncbi:LemA family protein [Aestuariimicrobium sp. Y1814]|uniref:LemA family protein n=1 Tax=Aestuariimicrobium sp. Y1814 TaxID=3418742 RepID=UPI003DA72F9C
MSGVIIVIIIIAAVLLLGGLLFIAPYNNFVKMRNVIQESWRQIDVELNRRYELIPNLIETVRAYAAHERNTLEEVTRLRNQAAALSQQGGSAPSDARSDVEAQLSGAVRNLLVSVESYPDLKSNQNFLELQRELTDTEDRIAAGRRFYNANVRNYNTKVEQVPSNIVANMFKFEKATYFEVNDAAVRQAPNVNFGEISYRPGSNGQQQGSSAPAIGSPQQFQQQHPTPQFGQQPQQAPQPQYQPQQQAAPQQSAPQQQYQAPQPQQSAPQQPPQSAPQQYQAPQAQPSAPQQQPSANQWQPVQSPQQQPSAQPQPSAGDYGQQANYGQQADYGQQANYGQQADYGQQPNQGGYQAPYQQQPPQQ